MASEHSNTLEAQPITSRASEKHFGSNDQKAGKNESGLYLFSNKNMEVSWIKNVNNYVVRPRTIVINLGREAAPIVPNKLEASKALLLKQPKVLHQWQSSLLSDVTILKAEFVLLVRDITGYDYKDPLLSRFYKFEDQNTTNLPVQNTAIRQEILNGDWEHISLFAPNLLDMALWRTPASKVKPIETLKFDPYFALGQAKDNNSNRELNFSVTNYLWFSPQQTNCGIHDHYFASDDPNKDPFIEVHTQISGMGRMLKYMSQEPTSLYEDVRMDPGRTHPVFCNVEDECTFVYPWHQYYADTDCVWLVTELRPIS